MNKIRFSAALLLVSVFVFGCASSGLVIDSKYEFQEFERVDRMSNYSLMSWQVVDSQSLIVQTSPRNYYLIVLTRPLTDLRFTQAISFTSTGSSIYAKFDCVRVHQLNCGMRPEEVPIYSIYKLTGRDDVARVKAQIEGESES